MTQRTVLVINSGSSSIKYQLVDPDSGTSLASGLVERIGEEIGAITHKHGEERTEITEPVPDHGFGLAEVLRLFEEQGPSLALEEVPGVLGGRCAQARGAVHYCPSAGTRADADADGEHRVCAHGHPRRPRPAGTGGSPAVLHVRDTTTGARGPTTPVDRQPPGRRTG